MNDGIQGELDFKFRFNQYQLKLWRRKGEEEKDVSNFKANRFGGNIFYPFNDVVNDFLSITVYRDKIKFWARISEAGNINDRHFCWTIPRSREQEEYEFGIPIENEMVKNENGKWVNKK